MIDRRDLVRLAALLGTMAGLAGYLYYYHFRVWDAASWHWLAKVVQKQGGVPGWMLVGLAYAVGALVLVNIVVNAWPSNEYGGARFARWFDVLRWSVSRKQGVALCRWRGKPLFAKELAVLIVGPAGTGKTEGSILPTLAAIDHASAIVFDPKVELAERTAGWREKVGRVEVLNIAAGPERSACFNPLDVGEIPKNGADRGTLVEQYMDIIIARLSGGASDGNFWNNNAAVLGTAVALWEVYEHEARGLSADFGAVTRTVGTWEAACRAAGLLDENGAPTSKDDAGEKPDSVGQALVEMAARAEREGWPQRIATVLYQYAAQDARTRAGAIATLFVALSPWLNDNIAGCMKSCSFSLKDFREGAKPLTVYVTAPPFGRQVYGMMLALILRALVQELTRRRPSRSDREVVFLIDEARFLPKTDVLQEGPAILRGYGVRLVTAWQDLVQAEAVYGRVGRTELINNQGYLVAYSQNDNETAEMLEKAIGNRTRRRRSKVHSLDKMGGGSRSVTDEGYPLVPTQKIKSLGRKVLVLRQGAHSTPILAPSCRYKNIGWVRRRLKRKPSAAVLRAIAANE